nr:CbtA family protein [uncultured Gellertiella sp.]
MITRHLLAALVAGVMAGILMTVVQQARVVPLILHAEEYEDKQAPAGDMTQHGASMSSMSMGQMDNQSSPATLSTPATGVAPAAEAAPAAESHAHHMGEHEEGGILFGLSRFAATLGANLVAAGGYALLLMAVSLLLGKPVTVGNGLAWGACGWLAVQFLPALGLPPELPGFPAADLASRQIWWVATIVLSVGGIGLIAFRDELAARIIGLLMILSPHVWGAPQPPTIETAVPAVLASEFAVAALGAALVMWLSLGLILGYLNARMEKVAR